MVKTIIDNWKKIEISLIIALLIACMLGIYGMKEQLIIGNERMNVVQKEIVYIMTDLSIAKNDRVSINNRLIRVETIMLPP